MSDQLIDGGVGREMRAEGGRGSADAPLAATTRRLRFLSTTALVAVGVALAWAPQSANAQSVWGGTGSSTTTADYNLGTNWSNPPAGAPPVNAGQAAVFDATGSATVTVTAGPITPDSWTFNATSQSYTVSGQAVNFNGAGPNVVNNANAGQAISISNNMTGAGISQAGASTLTLSGTNTFGTVTISAGTLKAGSTGAVGTTAAATVGSGGTTSTLDLAGNSITLGSLAGDATGQVTNSGGAAAVLTVGDATSTTFAGTIVNGASAVGLTKTGAGTLTLSGANTYTGATTINAGTLALSGTGSIAASSKVDLGAGTGTFDISAHTGNATITSLAGTGTGSSVALGANTLVLSNANDTYAGVISGTGGLTVSGGKETLTGANTYTGATNVSSGAVLNIQNNTALGTTAAGTTVASGGALELQGGITVTGEALSLAGTGVGGNGALRNISGNNTWTGGITLTGATRIQSDSGLLTISGNIGGAGQNLTLAGFGNGTVSGNINITTGSLTKSDIGNWTLSGNNTYSGATTVSSGHLVAGSTTAFSANSAFTVDSTLDLNGFNNSIGSLAGAATGIVANNGGAAATLTTGGDNTSTTFAGTIVDGTSVTGLTKVGTGTQTLSGNNTYSGATTVSAGTLQAGSTTAFSANSAFTVNATLDLNGFNNTIGSLAGAGTVTNNAAGTGTATLTTGGLASSTFTGVIQDGTTAKTALTKIGAGNTLTLSGSNTYSGATAVNAGVLQAGAANTFSANSAVTLANVANVTLDVNGFNQTIGSLAGGGATGGNVTLGTGTLTTGGDNSSTSYGGVISGSGGITKAGTGTFTVTGANTYTGATNVNAGVLNIRNATALGTNAGGTVVANGAALEIQGGITVTGEALNLAGTGVGGNGALRNVSGNNTWTGAITLSGTGARIGSAAGTLTISGGITGATPGQILGLTGPGNGTISGNITTNVAGLNKFGTGTWTLSGANTYTGDTNINAGTLALTGSVTSNVINSATFNLTGGTVTGTVTNNATMNASGTAATSGAFTNATNANLFVTGGTYTIGALLTNSGVVTVRNGATLTATVGGITNQAGGTITVDAGGVVNDDLNNAGAVTNNGTYNANVATNSGTITNNALWNGNVASSTGTIVNSGVWTGNIVSSGTLTSTGTITAGLTNSGTANVQGVLNGPIANNGSGVFTVTGPLSGNGGFVNASGATTNVGINTFMGLTSFANAGQVNLSGGTLGAGAVTNTGTIAVTGSGSTINATTLVNNGTIDLRGATPGSNLNATSAAYSGSGTVWTAINLNQATPNSQRTVTLNTGSTSNANGAGAIRFVQNGGGATGVFPIVNATGANAQTFTAQNLSNVGFINYALVAPGGPGNATNSWAVVGTPNPAAALTPLTSILSAISSIDASFHQPGGALVASPQTTETGLMVGGPWARASGGVTNIKSVGSMNLGNASITTDSKQRVQFSGLQAGADTGWLNLGNSGVNAHFGITGGQISADATEQTAGWSQIKFDVPFLGFYGLVTKGRLSTDFTYRHSWYDMNVTNPVAGLVNTGFKGQSDNVNGTVSYNFALPNNYFIEPTANLSYTRSTFDTLAVQTGTLSFDPVYSLLLRAGARVGTVFQYGGFNWSPFGLALVLNEFNKSAAGAYTSQNQLLQTVYGLSSTRVGTFYQTSAGLSFQSQTNGLIGFVRADLRFGDKVDGAALLGGVRYTFGP